MKPRALALLLALLLIFLVALGSRPARAEHTDVPAAMFSYFFLVPLSIVIPSVFGADMAFVDARSGPRFLLGWAWQIPLDQRGDYALSRHRLPLEVTLGLGDNAAPQDMKQLLGVDARLGYRFVLDREPYRAGFGFLVGGGGSMQATPIVNGGVYPEVGVRFRPHSVYPIVLALIARCDVRFAGADLVRPSVVLSMSVY